MTPIPPWPSTPTMSNGPTRAGRCDATSTIGFTTAHHRKDRPRLPGGRAESEASRGQDELADGAAALDQAVRLGGLGERQDAADPEAERAVGGPRDQLAASPA